MQRTSAARTERSPLIRPPGSARGVGPKEEHMGLSLSSPAFTPGGEIPALFTCEGRDLSPALEWTGVPEAAKSLAQAEPMGTNQKKK
jgi:phosphatidylethanolamine-binding protein (PEBP) family uncharacterized protein